MLYQVKKVGFAVLGNFLTVLAAPGFEGEAGQQFYNGLKLAKYLKNQATSSIVQQDWVYLACFPRVNSSRTPLFTSPTSGTSIVATGTWFHADGMATGEESSLLDYYQKFGARQLACALEGFFTIVIADASKQEVIVITDLVGSCHCYFREERNLVAISGSSLLLAALAPVHLDATGCQEFLNTGIIYEERTLFREVRKLRPASVFRFVRGSLGKCERYWKIEDLQPASLDSNVAAERLWHALKNAAVCVGKAFSRPVCDLTGGYDSRAVVAAFLGTGMRFASAVSGEESAADVRVSREIAHLFNLEHLHVRHVTGVPFEDVKGALALTDGAFSLVEYAAIIRVHRLLLERFDISINGSFGELARGYWWELLFPRVGSRRNLDAKLIARARFAAKPFDASLFAHDVALDLPSHFAGVIERTNAGLAELPNTLQMDHVYLMMRMQCWQGRIATSTDQLWPCLSPFMFRSVLEIVLQTQPQVRQRSLLIRQMLSRFQPELANVPLEHGYPAVPVTWKTWYRFWPVGVYYAAQAYRKAAHRLHWGTTSHRSSRSPRMQLWENTEVRELLTRSRMTLQLLFDPTRLEEYLKLSQQEAFPWDEQWMRMLSAEYTLRVLGQAGAGILS